MVTRKSSRRPTRRPLRQAKLGAVYTFSVPDGRYGVCQVLAKSKGSVELATLDYLEPARPTPQTIRGLKVCRTGIWGPEPERCQVDPRVPWWLEELAVIEAVETFDEPCHSYGSWQTVFAILYGERFANGEFNEEDFDFGPVDIDLGGGSVETRKDSQCEVIGPNGSYALPIPGRVRFEALDVLPYLSAVSYTGSDVGFVDYVAARKISSMIWRGHGQQKIDLRDSSVTDLSIDVGDAPVTLLAPETLLKLVVFGRADNLEVVGARIAFPFGLTIHSPSITSAPRGLESVRHLNCEGLIDTDTSGLASFRGLAELRLAGAPGGSEMPPASPPTRSSASWRSTNYTVSTWRTGRATGLSSMVQ